MTEDGIILVDKPAGISSFGVVGRVRWVLSRQLGRKVKVGHTGTLDPFATGLLILVVGKECRNAGHYSGLDKTYEAVFRLGQMSSTGDPEGELTVTADRQPSQQEVEAVLKEFMGTITQRPPIFSAIKIGGQRAYKLARAGHEVEIPLRQVTVHSLELLGYSYPDLSVRCRVSSGTYIRSLAVAIGEQLGTDAYCYGLRRTSVGDFDVAQAKPLDQFDNTYR